VLKVLDDCCARASVVTLMRGLGRSFGHVVSYHVKSGAKGSANMAELNVMTKHALHCAC